MYIDDFDKFQQLSIQYFKETKEMEKIEAEIEETDHCRVEDHRYFTFKRDNFTTKDLKNLEDTRGLTFRTGGYSNGRGYWKFKLEEDSEPEDELYKRLNELTNRHYQLGQHLHDMIGTNYPDCKIGDRRYHLELTSRFWGFKVRYTEDISLDEIIYIEEHTKATFKDKDAFGATFKWKTEE